MRDNIIRLWSESVLRNGDAAECQLDSRLGLFGQPFPPCVPLPYFCPSWVRNACIEISPSIARAVEVIGRGFFYDAQIRNRIPLPGHLRSLHGLQLDETGYAATHPVIRVDTFIDFECQTLKILEFNSADPSAFAWNDWMLAATESLVGAREFIIQHKLHADRIFPRHTEMVLASYAEYCAARGIQKNRDPLIVLLMPPSSSVYFDFCCLERLLRASGHRAILASAEELETVGTRAFCRGLPVDIVIRDTLDDVFDPESGKVIEPAATILLRSLACIVNPLASTIGDQKAVMPVLSQLLRSRGWCLQHGIDSDALAKWIPVTQRLAQDNAEEIAAEKDRWVLKPSCGYGGHGVYPGVDYSQDDWDAIVTARARETVPFVAQHFVTAGTGELPVWAGGKTDLRKVNANYSFWIINGRFAGAFVRMSDKTVINTHQGGALVPVYYFEDF